MSSWLPSRLLCTCMDGSNSQKSISLSQLLGLGKEVREKASWSKNVTNTRAGHQLRGQSNDVYWCLFLEDCSWTLLRTRFHITLSYREPTRYLVHGRTISLLPFDLKPLWRNRETVRSSRCIHYLSIYVTEWLISSLRNNRETVSLPGETLLFDHVFNHTGCHWAAVAVQDLCCWAGHHLPEAWPPDWCGYKQPVCKTSLRLGARLAVIRAPPGDAGSLSCGKGTLERDGAVLQRISWLSPLPLASSLSSIPPFLSPPPHWSPPCSTPDCLSARPARPTPCWSPTATAVVTCFSQENQQNSRLKNFSVLLLEPHTLLLCSLSSAELLSTSHHHLGQSKSWFRHFKLEKFDGWIWEMSAY